MKFSVINSLLPPTIHPCWNLRFTHSQSTSFTTVSPSSSVVSQMDVLAAPADRRKGWYLSLMAPNTKGPTFAWLDPSRLYCNSQVCDAWFLVTCNCFCCIPLSLNTCIKLCYNTKRQTVCPFNVHTLHFVHSLSLHLIQALADCVKDLLSPFHSDTIDLVAGMDAMGFILGKKKTHQFVLRREINSLLSHTKLYFKIQLLC